MANPFTVIGRILRTLFGSLFWTPPRWAASLGRLRRQRPGQFWTGLVLLLVLPLVLVAGYYRHRQPPDPLALTAEIEAPGLTPNLKNPRPAALRIGFVYVGDPTGLSPDIPEGPPSAARLDLVDQPLEQGVRLAPHLPGTWRWEGDRTLSFVPDREWPPGTRFEVRLDKQLFAAEARLASRRFEFQTPPMTVELAELEFYQNPKDRSIHQAVATLHFSHPVAEQSLAQKLSLTMRPSAEGSKGTPQPVEFSLSYDENRREVFVRSVPLTLPEQANYLQLSVESGVLSSSAGAPTGQSLTRQLLIPDRGSYLKVQSATAHILRNPQDEPEQILSLRFSDDIAEQELADKLQVWLLPVENPRRPDRRWAGPREVTAEILAQATPLPLKALETEHGFSREYHLPFDQPPDRSLYIRIQPGLTSVGGFVQESFYDTLLQVPRYPQELRLAADGSILSLSGSRQLGLLSRGLEAFQVRIGKLLPGQLQHLLSQTRGDLDDPHFQHYGFDQDNIVATVEQVLELKPLHPKQANYASVDLGAHLPGGRDRFGLFFIEVRGWDKNRQEAMGWVRDKRLILVTDLGLLVKDNADQSHEVFVQSLATGQPVPAAEVTLLGRNGLPLLSRTSDAQGHASFPVTRNFQREQEPTVYVVKTASDTSFIPFQRPTRRLNLSRFEVGGVHTLEQDGESLNGFLFSDRGLYRPGETVNLGAIVKSEPLNNIEGIPVEIAVRSPRGSEVASLRLTLPAKGFFDYSYATQPTSETGRYQVALYLVRDDKHRERLIGSAEFRLEEFQPDSLRIESALVGTDNLAWSSAEGLSARVRLNTLFGTPAQGRKVTAEMSLRSSRFWFKEYRDYTFADPWYDPEQPALEVNETLPTATTDEQGQVEFHLPLERFAAGTYLLTLTSEGFEPGGGRSVSARNSLLLSPLKTLVGTKSDGALDFIHQDAERFVEVIAIDPTLKARSLDGLQSRLSEVRRISTLVQQPNGNYAYQSVEKEQLLRTEDFAIAAEGSRYRLPSERPGSYLWEILDPQGLKLARVRFTVVGHGNLLGKLETDAELDLKLDRQDYKAGQRIEMNIVAPYTGSGLITIESDRVHSWKWFRSETSSSLQSIEIPAELEGNAYVNVTYVRDAASSEIFTSPLSYAVAPFTIDRGRRTLDLQLDAASQVRPGDTLEIGYSTSVPARIVVFAVNEGILQVADYQTPRPLDHFLRKRALQVGTLQMLDLLLPEFELLRKLSASGGDMADEAAGKALAANLNPFARALDEPAVFWSGILQADQDRRTVEFTVPDSFAGSLRLMAVAVADEAIGIAEASSLVRGPFVITPSLPPHAAPGDQFRVSAGISNLQEDSAAGASLNVGLEVSAGLEIIGDAEQTLIVEQGSEKTVHFQVRAKDQLGAAEVRFLVRSDAEQAQRRATMSLRPPQPHRTTFESGFTKDGKATLEVPRRLYADLAEQHLSASASPLVLIAGLSSYLQHFPHGCTEQLVSQVFPMIGLLSHPAFKDQLADQDEAVAAVIASLRSRQQADGSFSFWPGSRETAEFPTVYALHFLLEARELGYVVPEDLMRRGQDYLRGTVGRQATDLQQARLRAYAIYLLTRLGEVTTNHLASLQTWLEKEQGKDWRQDLAAVYMAGAYALLQRTEDARQLIGHYRLGDGGGEGEGTFYSPLARDAQFVYLLSRHFPKRAAQLDGATLLRFVEPVFRGRYHTLSAAYTILALASYGQIPEVLPQDQEMVFSAVDGEGQKRSLTAPASPLPRTGFGVDTAKLLLAADGPLFYLLSQAGFDRQMPTEALREGLEINREFLDDAGRPVNRLQQGQEVTVRLRVRALGEAVANVAVIDLLPGGFEVLRDSVPRSVAGWRADYVDVREDRLIFYGHFGTSVRELSYRAKVTGAGEFVIPPPWAEALYDRSVRAMGLPGSITVSPSP